MKIGTTCFITENARVKLGYPDGIVFTVKDILNDGEDMPIVLSANEFGKDWVQFFNKDEIIIIKK